MENAQSVATAPRVRVSLRVGVRIGVRVRARVGVRVRGYFNGKG